MSCCQVEILPNNLEIDQLRKEIVQARWEARLYKKFHQCNVKKREHIQYEHELETQKLKKKHREEVDKLQKTIEELKAKLKLRERQLFGKKSERHKDFKSTFSSTLIIFKTFNFVLRQL